MLQLTNFLLILLLGNTERMRWWGWKDNYAQEDDSILPILGRLNSSSSSSRLLLPSEDASVKPFSQFQIGSCSHALATPGIW